MSRTKITLTSLSLAFACAVFGCTGADPDDGRTLNQIIEDDTRIGEDETEDEDTEVDAGRVGSDAGTVDGGDVDDLDADEDEAVDEGDSTRGAKPGRDADGGCRWRGRGRFPRGAGPALDGGLGIPGFGGFGDIGRPGDGPGPRPGPRVGEPPDGHDREAPGVRPGPLPRD